MVRRSSRVSRKSRSKVNRKMKRSRKVSRRVNKSRKVSRRKTKRVNKSRRVSRKRTKRIEGGSDSLKKNPPTSPSSSSTPLTPEKILSMALKEEITIEEANEKFSKLNISDPKLVEKFALQINNIMITFKSKEKAKKAKAERLAAKERKEQEDLQTEAEKLVTEFMEKYERAGMEERESLLLGDRPGEAGDFNKFYGEHHGQTHPILTTKLSELKEKEKKEAVAHLDKVNALLFKRIQELKNLRPCTSNRFHEAKFGFVGGRYEAIHIDSGWYELSDQTLTQKLFNHFANAQKNLFSVDNYFHFYGPFDKPPKWMKSAEEVYGNVVKVDVESIFPSSEFGKRSLQDLIENLENLKKSTLDGLDHEYIVKLTNDWIKFKDNPGDFAGGQ